MPDFADQVIAIDILLEPDARMLQRASANNARLRPRRCTSSVRSEPPRRSSKGSI